MSYLIVGGLKGLCGSLAIQLARRGAKHIIAMARSGYDDDVSQATIKSVESEGAEVQLMIGDVSRLEDVKDVFSKSIRPIAGIVQGAMVLRVSLPIHQCQSRCRRKTNHALPDRTKSSHP